MVTPHNLSEPETIGLSVPPGGGNFSLIVGMSFDEACGLACKNIGIDHEQAEQKGTTSDKKHFLCSWCMSENPMTSG
jgi:hypothetical protein